jgi:predicted RNase H-like HicB family nuclease
MGFMSDSEPMRFSVEVEREEDGRWIAEVASLPGVIAYGKTQQEALAAAEALALRVVADRLEHGELDPEHIGLSFVLG